eukprot:TRINITY_DN965_c0_g1_i3.p2 TRINITY_DN965_c0_g1~~TRINITY_DN965_c0_g1_i3.p2  ORF type:complete len:153 (-),score=34.58 TRINITY_DN965_c0_g1_i3:76-534(-)
MPKMASTRPSHDADLYDTVRTNRLRLKKPSTKNTRKRKRPNNESTSSSTSAPSSSSDSASTSTSTSTTSKQPSVATVQDRDGGVEDGVMVKIPRGEEAKTVAERKFEEVKRRREAKELARLAGKSHREKIEEFNKQLDKLPTHFDIPKVGPG